MNNNKKSVHLIFAIVMSCSVVGTFLQTALVVAIPKIMSEFQVPATTVQWLTSAYSLAMGIMIPATAFLMKRFKTRQLLLAGIVFYLIGLSCAALANTFTLLLIGRIIQALGAGLTVSLTQVVIIAIFPLNKRGSAMGIYGLAIGVAPVIAPILSGIIVDVYTWRLIFIIGLILMITNFIVAFRSMENVLPNEMVSFDLVSFLMSAIGFSALLVGLGNISQTDTLTTTVLLPIGIGIVALMLFVQRQLKSDMPFLEMRTFKNKKFRLAVIMSILLYMVMIATSTLMPLYLQEVKKMTATRAGIVMLPGSLLMAIISPIAGKVYDRFGIRILSIAGSVAMFIGCIGLSFVTETTPIAYIVVVYALRVLAISCVLMPLVTWGLGTLEQHHTSHGSALLTTLRTIAGAISAAIFVAIMSMASTGDTSVTESISARGIDVAFIGITILALFQMILAYRHVRDVKSEELIS